MLNTVDSGLWTGDSLRNQHLQEINWMNLIEVDMVCSFVNVCLMDDVDIKDKFDF